MADFWSDGGFSLYGGDSGFDFSTPSYSFDNFSPSLDTSWLSSYTGSPEFGGGYGGSPGYGAGGWGSFFANPQTLMGLAGGASGIIGALMGDGKVGTQTPVIPDAARQQYAAAQGATGQMRGLAQGNTALQKQQAKILRSIFQGQGLSAPYAEGVERAFEPALGNLYEQATKAGRSRGFYDSPATSPAGGAIFGPGLADLQGQIAQAKLNLMMGLPGLYNVPIQNRMGAASGFAGQMGNLFNMYPTGQQTSRPLAPQIGTALGQGLIGLGQGFGQQQQQNQQNQWNQQMMRYLQQNRSPYEFGGYSGI